MSFLGRIIRFLFWVLVVSWAVKLLGKVIGGASTPRTAPGEGQSKPVASSKRLVKDPMCGTYMAEELALPLEANGGTLHFCSPECRAKYENSMVRRAANA